jgi:hypothetical protein
VCLLPWPDVGLQILIHAHYGHCEGYVHADRHRVRPVQRTDSLVFYYLFYALSSCQIRAQLKSLFDHYTFWMKKPENLLSLGVMKKSCANVVMAPIIAVCKISNY